MKRYTQILFLGLGIIIALGFCAAVAFVTTGSGLTILYFRDTNRRPTAAPVVTLRALSLVRGTATPALTATPTVAPLADVSSIEAITEPDTPTPTAPPAETETPPPPSTPTDAPPPTDTPPPVQPPPATNTPVPTDTPAPSYDFAVIENDQFPTGKADLDVFIAVTNRDNKPIGGYRVIGNHSGGMQVESAVSAGDWTENSGANHYKAGNIKLSVPNSPGGSWTLQLVDEGSQPAAAPLELPFDEFNPSWYFVLFQEVD